MKKLLALVLALLLVTALVACGSETPMDSEINISNESDQTTTEPAATDAATEETVETTTDLENWGQEDTVWTDNGEVMDAYYIHVPKYTGAYHMYAMISEQGDDTAVLLTGQDYDTPVVDDESKVFSAYVDYTIESLKDLYGSRSDNYQIVIDSSESVAIGDHDMYIHIGTITFDYSETVRSYQYVAYATLMKDSGNSAYWMVYDISEDQSNGDLIAEHALNMAKTFREEQ